MLVEQMERRYPSDPAGRASIAASYVNLGLFRATRRDLPGARSLYEQAITIFDALPTERRSRDEVMRSHAFALKRRGAILLAEGQIDGGPSNGTARRWYSTRRWWRGLGFTLTGIGGLVALHRTVRTDVLREGLKTGTLNSILFPSDPLRNAPQIFSDLRRVFPPTAGRHVVGPMVQLRWGSPTLLTLDLALLVELPAPIRVIVLGRLQVLLRNQSHPLIQIRMDALGVLDVSAETVALDATLYDSRILQFTLTGDMALRAGWGRQPQFVLAIGGFHPRFAPPPGLPAFQRLALQLADGDSLQLRCQAYLAVTSNTVQFGARVDLHAAGGGFSFDWMLGFDAIIQLAPLAFEVDVGAALALRYHGRLLMGISFKGRLAGRARS